MTELTSSGGWTCSNCGEWIPSGQTHVCVTREQYYPSWPAYYQPAPPWNELVDLLDRIAAALESMAGLKQDG